MRTVLLAAVATAVLGQSATPTFEVASIKPHPADLSEGTTLIPAPGGRLTILNAPLRVLLLLAYRIQKSQLFGGPDWMSSVPFDVTAKAAEDSTTEQMWPMLQTLLNDRFKIRSHPETRELPVYALVRARMNSSLGPGLKPSESDCTKGQCDFQLRLGSFHVRGFPMSALTNTLSQYSGRLVIDRTEITGPQNVDLTWAAETVSVNQPNSPAEANAPSLFTAVQEQLGLKLESTKARVEVLVIDHAEKPAPD